MTRAWTCIGGAWPARTLSIAWPARALSSGAFSLPASAHPQSGRDRPVANELLSVRLQLGRCDSAIRINKQILKCGGEELQGFIAQRSAEFNPVNVATALRKVLEAKQAFTAAPEHADQMVRALEERLEATLSDFKPQDIATSVWAFAKMRSKPGQRVLHAIETRVVATAREFNSQDVAQTMWAFAKMGVRPREPAMGLLLQRTEANAAQFNAQDISNALWALATFEQTPPATFTRQGTHPVCISVPFEQTPPASVLRALEMRTAQLAEQFAAHNVACSLWSFARMGWQPSAEVLAALVQRAGAIVEHFNLQGIMFTLSALAIIELGPCEQAACRLVRKLVLHQVNLKHRPDVVWKLNVLNPRS